MKRDYLSRLSRAARWYLPPAEAAEVLEDYQEIVEGRSEEELERDLGTPRAVARQLAQPKAYRRWLLVFVVLAVCVLIPAVSPIWNQLFGRLGLYWATWLNWGFLLVGLGLSFLWFRRNGKQEERLPAGIAAAMLIPLAGMAWSVFLGISVLYYRGPLIQFTIKYPISGLAFHWLLMLGGLIMGLTSLFGLIRARLGDRRWQAVYVLGLSGTLLSLFVWAVMSSFSIDFTTTGWQTSSLVNFLLVTLIGLVGTAVSLC